MNNKANVFLWFPFSFGILDGKIASSTIFPNQGKTTASWKDTNVFSQCRTQLESSQIAFLSETHQGPWGHGDTPCEYGKGAGTQTRKIYMGKYKCICLWCIWRILEKEQTLAVTIDLEDAYNRVQFKLLMVLPARAVWSQPDTVPVDCRSAQGKDSGHAAWNLELCSSSARSEPTTRTTAVVIPLPRPWQIWTEMGLTRYSHRQMTDSWTKHLGTPKRQSQQCNNWITYPDPSGIKTPDLSSTQTRHKHYGVLGTVEQQAKRCWPAVTFDGACRRTEKSSEIPWDPLR